MEPTINQEFIKGSLIENETARVKIHTGFGCNANCVFCYYHKLLRTPNLPIELINEQVKLVKDLGYKDVDFSGGESTIIPGFENVISLAKELGFRRINVITNGIMLSNEKFYSNLMNAGLNETLFSLHGYPSDVHDSLVRVPGAFQKISNAMKIAKELGVTIRTNITINNLNYKTLKQYVNYILKFEPENINFIFLNPWTTEDINPKKLFVRYSEAIPYLLDAFDSLEGAPVKVALRYIPYCVIPEEYRGFIVNFINRRFDPYEWGYPYSAFTERFAYKYLNNKSIDVKKEWKKYKMGLRFYNVAIFARYKPSAIIDGFLLKTYTSDLRFSLQKHKKINTCNYCELKTLCEGIKNEYLEEFGDKEFNAINNGQIK